MPTPFSRSLAIALAALTIIAASAAGALDLGSAQLQIAGTRLTVSPESQTVPNNTATIVETHLEGYDVGSGTLPADLKVVADFTGPEIDGIQRLETVPNEPFRIPRLRLEGQYQLDNIRLVQGEELLAYAEPRSSGVLVTQVLVARVTSRALTLDEVRSYGIVVDDDRFHAFNFTFGFAVDGQVFSYNMPVLFGGGGSLPTSVQVLRPPNLAGGGGGGTSSPRFRPPRLAPFTLELETPRRDEPNGGCKAINGCYKADPVSLPGVILFPADVSLLNQLFSVVVVAKNAAPEGDPLTIRDLTAKVSLPAGLRVAETEPPTPLGVPVPVRVPGPDGTLGTGDDLTFLIAQAAGQAEVLVEGKSEGTHLVEFALEGVLDGFPDGEIRRVTGTARGAVVVRDPTLGVTITHPDVLRTDEEYSLLLTISNTGNAPVNLLTLSLPISGLSGTEVVGASSQTIPSLLPGDSELVEFRLVSHRTGKVVATAIRHGSQIDPRFEFSVGVGELGIPLSPEAIILPDSTDNLPQDLVRHALALIGLGYSLGTAPVESLAPGNPQIDLASLHEKVYWLGAAGRHVGLGEDLFDAAAVLAAEWTGARSPDWGWDELRRKTTKGGLVGQSLGDVFAAEAAGTTPVAAFERFAATASYLGPVQGALAVGTNTKLSITSRTSGKTVSGSGSDLSRLRDLPFADLYDLGGSQMGLLGWPEEGGYRVRIEDPDGGPAELHLLIPGPSGELRRIHWSGISLSAGGSAEVAYQAADTQLTLAVDADGDGTPESDLPGTETTVPPRAFAAVAAVQDSAAVSGHVVEVLFTQDVDLQKLLPADPARFSIPGLVSNGGMVQAEADFCEGGLLGGCNGDPEAEENTGTGYLPGPRVIDNPFAGLLNTRVVRVVFNNPVSPYKQHDLTVQDVTSLTGEAIANAVLPVTTTVTDPGEIVQGTVFGPGGQPVPFARVELLQVESSPLGCTAYKAAEVQTDGAGRFEFDYVRQTDCSDLFTIRATDPVTGAHGNSRGRVRFVGQTAQLDVLMLGRGTVRGRVTYDDGSVPERPQVTGYSPVFFEGKEATYGPDGTYEIRDLPVGTISLGATDRQGGYVFQTVEIERAGAVVERDLTIIRKAPDEPTGDVRGTVYATDGTTPIYDAYVALYVDGELAGVERSGLDGTFDFGTVRAGLAEIEAFDAATGLSGAQLFFDVQPDQVNDVAVLLKDDRGTVEGHVYRQTLDSVTPLAGAVVWVSGTPFNTVTDANGFYRLEGVFSGNHSLLAADLERQVQVSEAVTISADGQTVTRDLYFVESVGSGLAGEVLGFSGNPVPGAVIHLDDGHGGWWKEAHTDGSGRFAIPNLAPGGYKLYVFSGATGTVATATIRFEGETPFVHVRFKKGTIRGTTQTINASGQVVGVQSLVTYRTTVPLTTGIVALDYSAHTLETDADGTFEIPDVLAGSYRLTVSNAFYGEKTFRDEIVFHGEVRQHDVVFQPSGEVRGVLLDWDGETPVAGATVNLRHPSFSAYDVVTDAEGRFTFSLIPPKSSRFAIDAEVEQSGVFRTARIWAAVTKPGQELDVEIVLPQQGTVSGWVEDADGAAVPGAVVTLKESAFPQRRLVHNSDADGNFSFTNVFAGPVAISAQAPELGGLGGRDTVELVEEGQEVFSVVVLEGTGEVTGRVISPETGEVVPTAQVALDRGIRNNFDSITTTEGELRFRLLPLDTYRIRVFDPTTGRFGRSDWFSVDYNGQVVDVPVTLEARGSVDGHLYEPESLLGVPAATIRLSTQSLRRFTTYASTDVDGYFEFEGIPEGTFTLDTREPEGRRRASGTGEIVEEDQLVTVDLYLEQVGRVVGSVLSPAGQPAGLFANANAVLYENGQVVGATLDNPFTFDGIIAGRRLEVRAYENGGDHRGSVKGTLAEGEAEITLDVEMQPIGSAAVTVLDSGGNPVSGVDVRLHNNGFYGWKSLAATSGADGRAVFDDIGVGWIGVSATQPVTLLHGSAEGALSQDGEQVELSVQLQDSGVVKGRAVLSDGVTPAVDALVVVKRGSRTLQALVDGNGDFELPSVPLGSYSLYVQESFGPGTIERFGSMDANGEIDDFGTLVLDSEQPQVVSLEPTSGSADLPLATVVTVRFSEPVDTSRWSGSWITFRKLSSSYVSSTPSWSEGDTVLTLTPSSPLASFTAYEVLVQDVIDLAGKHLADRVRTTWNTVDVVPPTVVDVVPRDGQSQIPVDASILVTFSEEVAFASLSGSAFQLTDLSTGLGVTTTFQHLTGERQVLVTPASGLQTDRQYQLTVQGVQDNGGNVMSQAVTTSFWTVDTIPPEIVSVDFPAGTSFVSGDDVPVAVTATDERGVAVVEMTITEWSWSATDAPYELTGLAPVVDVASAVTVDVTVRDLFDNVSTTQATIQVAPRSNANPPEVAALCGADGDFVVPSVASIFSASFEDDEAIESVKFLVDGQELDRITPVNEVSQTASFEWSPAVGTPAGTVFTVRVEARDFAGNLAAHEVDVSTPSGEERLGGGSIYNLYAGQSLTLADGEFLIHEDLDLGSLQVLRGATVTVPAAGTPLVLRADGSVRVHCGASIDVTGMGYAGGTSPDGVGEAPSWVAPSQPISGGSHGGGGAIWADSTEAPGDVFDSVYRPSLGGGGGSLGQGSGSGHPGGGVLDIQAGDVVLDGDLIARGAGGGTLSDSSGAGGTISIEAGALRGTGVVDASGGGYVVTWGGASGGGGRVALRVGSFDGFDPSTQAKAWGGKLSGQGGPWYGAPGTVYVKDLASTYGRLIVDNGTESDGSVRGGPVTELPALGTGSVVAYEIQGADAWVTASEPFRPRWLGAWMALTDGSGTDLGSFEVVDIDAAGRVLLTSGGSVAAPGTYRGEYRFDRIDRMHSSSFEASDPVSSETLVLEGDVQIEPEVSVSDIVVKSGAIVRPLTGGSLHLSVSGTLTIEPGASIDVTGTGYPGGKPPDGLGGVPAWVIPSAPSSGGSHGGHGTAWGDTPEAWGEVFDSVYFPSLGGGGGSLGKDHGSGRSGGGVIAIEAGELVLDGSLVARGGGPGYLSESSGAGGSVLVEAGVMRGGGSIDASGSEYQADWAGGAGGGGRVALRADTFDGFDPSSQAKAWGGWLYTNKVEYAAPGTILFKDAGSTYGRLIIDNGTDSNGIPRVGPVTDLPTLGSGSVVTIEAEAGDAWVTAAGPFRTRWLGAWMGLEDASGADLGTFGVVELDGTGRARLAGAGSVVTAATYRGEYRFDTIARRHGSWVSSQDPVTLVDQVFDEDALVYGPVNAQTIVVKQGVTVRPAGDSLHLTASDRVTIEAGGRLDVSELGYANGGAPDGVTGSLGRAGGSHGGIGSQGTTANPAGETYDSVYRPVWPGGGGAEGSQARGSAGGGVVEIIADEVVLDGEISATSWDATGNYEYGGAGGSVTIEAGTLSGGGSIDASGGRGEINNYYKVGAGGGGRVVLDVGALVGFDPAVQVSAIGGGHSGSGTDHFASPGTVLVKQLGDAYGHLRIDAAVPDGVVPVELPPTILPAIGKGTVGVTTVDSQDATDLWIGDQDSTKLFSLGVDGMWVRVGGVDYPVIDQSADRRQLLLDGAAGTVSSGDAYLGMYKFDSVTVTGDAILDIRDGEEVGVWNVDPGSTVTHFDLDPPVITVTGPAAGTLFIEGDPMTVTADVTDPSGVTTVTFTMAGQSFADDTAPYEWVTNAPTVGTEQDVAIQVDATDGNDNTGSVTHTVRVTPAAPAVPPVVTITCPSPGARLAPSTGLDFAFTATHDDGIERVELRVGDDPTPVDSDSTAPYTLHFDAPVDATEGDVITLHLMARSNGGVWGEAVYTVEVVAANVVSSDTTFAASDLSLEGSSVVVSGGTLTIEGPHSFRDLVVLDGATVTHPASTETTDERLELSLTRDLFVACSGSIDATGKGSPGSVSYHDPGESTFLGADDFNDSGTTGWQIVDEGELNAPSNWHTSFSNLAQTSNIHSDASPGKGTYALWSAGIAQPDYRASYFFRSTDDDGVGLMFRYVDADNYYRFVWYRNPKSRRLEKIADGVVTVLAEEPVLYGSNTWYLVQVVADGPDLEVWINGDRIFAVTDSTHASGNVAFYTWGNAGTYFEDFQVNPLESPSVFAGGSHGGLGGSPDGTTRVYGNLFDPDDPGAGGAGLTAAPGGGVIRIAAAGQAIVDGAIGAKGSASIDLRSSSAGGSIRLDATTITGTGSIDASGGGGVSRPAGGGGGRIALYGSSIDQGILGRTIAAGGDGDSATQRGAAGTIFVKRDSQGFGDLILDNGGLDAAQPTELLAAGPGSVDALGGSTITDDEAVFLHDLTGMDVFFNGDQTALWPIVSHADRGQTLDLDTSSQPLTAQAGDSYEGLYRFDRVIVRGGAEAVTLNPVDSPAPEVDAGASWTPITQSVLTLTSPASGQGVPAGSTMTVAASVDDAFGVEAVRFRVAGEVYLDSSPPFEWTLIAPFVTATTGSTVVAEAVDLAGHALRDTVDIELQPGTDAVAPVLNRAPCPQTGDLVTAGSTVSFDLSLSDEALLYQATLRVDGVVNDQITKIDLSALATTLSFTVPVDTPPGTQLSVELEVMDYGQNVATETFVLAVPTGTVLVGDQGLDSSLNGTDLVLGAGTFTLSEPLSLSTLTLLEGATVLTGSGLPLSFETAGAVSVQCGAAIDASATGYPGVSTQVTSGTAPSWVSPSTPISGGSHGGFGTAWSDSYGGVAGATFDSVYMPGLGGGSGALGPNTSRSGAGGGIVEIRAGSMLLDGEIRAMGEVRSGYSDSSGGGGSVFIAATSMAGTGTVDASGGDYTVHWGGGAGGGGRVALHVDSFQGFDPTTQVFARGGTVNGTNPTKYAGAGTIYVKELGSTYGRLIIDNGTETDGTPRVGPATELPALGSGAVSLFEASGTDAWVTAASPFRARWLGAWMMLEDGTGADLGAFEVVEIDTSGRARVAGAASVSGVASYRGEYRFDQIDTGAGAGIVASDDLSSSVFVYSGESRALAVVEADAVTVQSGAVVEPLAGSSLRFLVAGAFTVESGGLLDLTGFGYEGGNDQHEPGLAPSSVTGSGRSEGGSHGGLAKGGAYQSTYDPGEVFDSVYFPALGGGGGGRYNTSNWGGSGGGVLEIEAGSVVVDGEIRSRGGDPDYYSGAGAGGTVVIDAGSLAGTGMIDVSGGDYYKAQLGGWGPPGGGGRVALLVDDLSQFDVESQVWVAGGKRFGYSTEVQATAASGTLFVLQPTSTFGDLLVHLPPPLGPNPVPNTTLPTIGTGTVGVADPDTDDPTDLWIEPQDPAALFSLGTVGMSVRVSGADYLVIDQSVDRRRLLLDGAAGAVGVGDTYEGVYTFDTVTVRGGAVLEFLDTADVTTYDVDADSQVILPQ